MLLHAIARDEEQVVPAWSWKPGEDEFHPDVMMVPEVTDRTRFTGTPLLCVEITSGNRAHDVVTKRAKYAAAGLPEYWIVDRQDRVLRRLRLEDGVLVETGLDAPAGIAVPNGSAPRAEGPGVITANFAGREVIVDVDYVFAL